MGGGRLSWKGDGQSQEFEKTEGLRVGLQMSAYRAETGEGARPLPASRHLSNAGSCPKTLLLGGGHPLPDPPPCGDILWKAGFTLLVQNGVQMIDKVYRRFGDLFGTTSRYPMEIRSRDLGCPRMWPEGRELRKYELLFLNPRSHMPLKQHHPGRRAYASVTAKRGVGPLTPRPPPNRPRCSLPARAARPGSTSSARSSA